MADKRVWCGVCEASCGLIATVQDGKILQFAPGQGAPPVPGIRLPEGHQFP